VVIVEGTIKGKARPRVFGKHAITPEDTVNYENWVKICYQQQYGRHIDGPVKAVINVYHKVPKSCTCRIRELAKNKIANSLNSYIKSVKTKVIFYFCIKL